MNQTENIARYCLSERDVLVGQVPRPASPSTLDPNTSGSPAAVVPCVGSEAQALCNARRPPPAPRRDDFSRRWTEPITSSHLPLRHRLCISTLAVTVGAGVGDVGWEASRLAETGNMLPFR